MTSLARNPRGALPLAAAALAALTSCAGSRASSRSAAAGPLHPADPALAAPDAPREAVAEVSGVSVRVQVGNWRGQPRDLELRLTPADVVVQNGSGKPIEVGPERFGLIVDGKRLGVLDHREVNRALADLTGFRRPPPIHIGAVGGPTFPGYDTATDPYAQGTGAVASTPVPPPGEWYESQLPSGELAPGASTGMVLFFDTPARSLTKATFEFDVVARDGTKLGTVRIPYARE